MRPEQLIKFNGWWSTGQLPKQFIWKLKRFAFKKIFSHLENPYILLLTGLRRSGKTVIVYQCIEKLLNQGVPPENILYLSFEDMLGTNLKEIIEAYRKLALPKGKVYCFFDEVHFLPDWSNQIKVYFDQKENMKFVVTGSSSHLMLQTTSESLTGRVNILPLYPMSFREFLHLKGISVDTSLTIFDDGIQKIDKEKVKLLGFKEQFNQEFESFLAFGGIPEHLDKFSNVESWHQFLRQNYLILVMFKDILMSYEIRDSRTLLSLTQYLADTITTPLSLNSISKILGVKKDTVSNYLRYLEEAFLIGEANFFSASPAKTIRRNSKIYLSDIGLVQAISTTFLFQSDTEMSKIIESFIFQELRAALMNHTGYEFPDMYYWKNKHEVDFILKTSHLTLPIEVKYRNQIDMKDLKGLTDFCMQFGLNLGLLVTKDIFEVRMVSSNIRIHLIPAMIFSLML